MRAIRLLAVLVLVTGATACNSPTGSDSALTLTPVAPNLDGSIYMGSGTRADTTSTETQSADSTVSVQGSGYIGGSF